MNKISPNILIFAGVLLAIIVIILLAFILIKNNQTGMINSNDDSPKPTLAPSQILFETDQSGGYAIFVINKPQIADILSDWNILRSDFSKPIILKFFTEETPPEHEDSLLSVSRQAGSNEYDVIVSTEVIKRSDSSQYLLESFLSLMYANSSLNSSREEEEVGLALKKLGSGEHMVIAARDDLIENAR